jgi:exopolyphosphatase/guanosine-5'-triphosphate,3'-diphosphate pyrophosphatase
MAEQSTIAAVDLGSNSFHCQIARVAGEQFFPLDSLREPVRLGAGLSKDKKLDEESQERAHKPLWVSRSKWSQVAKKRG